MSTRSIGDGNEDELGVRHSRDQFFGDAELGRVDEIVGGVDPEDRSGDGGELRLGVVVARGVDVVEEVVGVGVSGEAGKSSIGISLGLGARGEVLLHLERSRAGDRDQIVGAAETLDGFGGVVAVLPRRIIANDLHGHVAPHAVAAGELDGQAGEGRQGVGELRIGFAPDEGLHAAHRGAEDEAEVVDVQAFEEHGVLGPNHVVVIVLGEVHAEAVGGLAGLAVADVVGEDDEELGDVERLAGAEEDVGEDRVEQRVGATAGAMEEQDGVIGMSSAIAAWLAESEVVELQLGKGFAATEVEVFDDVRAVLDRPFGRTVRRLGVGGESCKNGEEGEATDQWMPPLRQMTISRLASRHSLHRRRISIIAGGKRVIRIAPRPEPLYSHL